MKAGKGSGGIIEMTTSVYESTVLKMRGLEDTDLLVVCEFIDRLSSKNKIRKEMYNPYKPLTREEIIEQLSIAKRHADEGKVMEAHQASENVRKKYGL